VWPGGGCGRPLPPGVPATQIGRSTGYAHFQVPTEGRNLTGTLGPKGARSFWVRVPVDYDPTRPYRVVYLGQGCSGGQMANTNAYPLYNESQKGNEEAIYVALDTPEDGVNQDCYDNQSGPASEEWEAFEDIQRFVDANYCLDLNKIYVAGYSSGAWLAAQWGCYFAGWPTPARAIAPQYHVRAQAGYFGGEPANDPPCGGPVAALWTQDAFYGPAPEQGTAAALARLGRMNGCDTSSTAPQEPWHPELGNACTKFTTCPADYPVVLCTAQGAGHSDSRPFMLPATTAFFDELEAARGPGAGTTATVAPPAPVPPASATPPLSENRAPKTIVADACLTHVPATPTDNVDLALAGGRLYWTDRSAGQILSVPTAGGAPALLASGESVPFQLVARGGRLFWISDDPERPGRGLVRTVATAGGPATTLASMASGFGVSDDGGTVFVGNEDAQIVALPVGGGPPAVVAAQTYAESFAVFAVAGTKLALPASTFEIDVLDLAGGGVARCGPDPSTGASSFDHCLRIARGEGGLAPLAFDGDSLYWSGGDHVGRADTSLAGADRTTRGDVLFLGFGPVQFLTLAGDSLFFWSSGDACIERLGLAPGAQATEVICGSAPQSPIVADETNIYWATDGCVIMSAPR